MKITIVAAWGLAAALLLPSAARGGVTNDVPPGALTPALTPVPPWTQALAQAQTTAPAQAPATARAQARAQAPATAPATAPVQAPATAPATAPARAPARAPTIELITMGYGALLWEKFGHAALCVRHADPRKDLCYNYGTTDFSSPLLLIWEFLRGRSLFWVSTTRPERMLYFYSKYSDRSVWVQKLPLSPERAQKAADLLKEATVGDNKYYKYHHYDDNCATRVRDIIDSVTDSTLAGATAPYEFTLRDITRRGFTEYPSLALLTDFFLGTNGDRYPSLYEAMHLPDVLRDQVHLRLDVEPVTLYERKGRPFDVSHPASRWWLIFIALVIAIPAAVTWFTGHYQRLGLAITALPVGLMGTVLWAMAIISSLPEIRYNETVLVFVPFDLALPFLSEPRRRLYGRIRTAMLVVAALLAAVGVLGQPLWSLIFIALMPNAIAALPKRA